MSAGQARETGEIFGPRMTLFADVLSVGVCTALVSLPVVTLPAALSTACAVMRGAREDQPATAGRYLATLRRRLRAGDLAAGALSLAGVLLLWADLALARAGLPGAPLFAIVAAAIGAYAAVVAFAPAGAPSRSPTGGRPWPGPPGTPYGTRAAAVLSYSPSWRPRCARGCSCRWRSWRRDRWRWRSRRSTYGCRTGQEGENTARVTYATGPRWNS